MRRGSSTVTPASPGTAGLLPSPDKASLPPPLHSASAPAPEWLSVAQASQPLLHPQVPQAPPARRDANSLTSPHSCSAPRHLQQRPACHPRSPSVPYPLLPHPSDDQGLQFHLYTLSQTLCFSPSRPHCLRPGQPLWPLRASRPMCSGTAAADLW